MCRILVLASGGMDSTVLLYKAVKEVGAENVYALNMYYGQRHAKEAFCFAWQIEHLGIKNWRSLDVKQIYDSDVNCTLLKGNGSVPHGTYAEQKPEGGAVSTYVPFRNGLFLAIAASIAEQYGYDEIWYGAHRDDIAGDAYPDCSSAFIRTMNAAIFNGTAAHIEMKAPWESYNKIDIAREAKRMGITQEEIAHTWSCYEGGDKPCGKCATCIDRAHALSDAGYENC